MLIELAIGDAYGAGFEFRSADFVRLKNNLSEYIPHELGNVAGCYTDDTQMSLAIAELLIDEMPLKRESLADKFWECFHRDRRIGYSKRTEKAFCSAKSGGELLEIIDANSIRNGAAMRAAPIGVIHELDTLLSMSELQASLTHNTREGIISSQAVSLASHYYFYKRGSKVELVDFVSHYTNYRWDVAWNASVGCDGIETVNALLTVLTSGASLRELLLKSVNFGGDIDTVAALALGIGSLSNEYEKDLPMFLFNDLENGKYGKDYLVQVDQKLLNPPHQAIAGQYR